MFDITFLFFFSSRRRHTTCSRDWSSDVCSSDLNHPAELALAQYMTDAANGKAVLSEDTIERIGKDVMDALDRKSVV